MYVKYTFLTHPHTQLHSADVLEGLTSLEVLDLSDNVLDTVLGCGIGSLSRLARLDLSRNPSLRDPLLPLALMVSGLPLLESVAVDDTGTMSTAAGKRTSPAAARSALLAALPCLANNGCVLAEVDGAAITVGERSVAWRTHFAHLPPEEASLRLTLSALFHCVVPRGAAWSTVRVLDVSHMGLASLGVDSFSSLEVLVARGNGFRLLRADAGAANLAAEDTSSTDARADSALAPLPPTTRHWAPETLSGLAAVSRTLRVLDVSGCRIADVAMVAEVVEGGSLEVLESLDLRGNPVFPGTVDADSHDSSGKVPTAGTPRHRLALLAQLPRLLDPMTSLVELNGAPIEVAEITRALRPRDGELEAFRWRVELHRAQRRVRAATGVDTASSIDDLALRGRALCLPPPLADFVALETLDLGDNKLTDSAFVRGAATSSSSSGSAGSSNAVQWFFFFLNFFILFLHWW
jgi:hypothetical protein